VYKSLTEGSDESNYSPSGMGGCSLTPTALDILPKNELVLEVINCINELLPVSRCTLIIVADRLNINPRTLQRRLAKCGIDFEGCVVVIRHSWAKLLLSESELTVDEIAKELGYRRTTSFCRAHKTWFGLPPLEHRYRLQN